MAAQLARQGDVRFLSQSEFPLKTRSEPSLVLRVSSSRALTASEDLGVDSVGCRTRTGSQPSRSSRQPGSSIFLISSHRRWSTTLSSLLTLLLVCPSSCDIVTPPDEREGLRRGGELQIATKFSITCETLSSFPLLYLGLDTPYLLTEDDA